MTPFVGMGEAIHDPGCSLAFLEDIGWTTRDLVNGPATVSTCAEEPIPTMSEWGLMIFGLLVLNLGVIFLRRRESILAA